MKLLLIREKTSFYKYSNTSYGLGLIGTLCKKIAEVKILDNNSIYKEYSIQEILGYIKEYSPDVIGFNLHAFNILSSRELIAAAAKAFPHICLLAGGLHTYSKPDEVAALEPHIVMKGEADLTAPRLMQTLKEHLKKDKAKFTVSPELAQALRSIPGLMFRQEERTEWEDTGHPLVITELDALPFVDYTLFNLKDFLKGPKDYHYVTNVLITQRGCPFQCPFCQNKDNQDFNQVRENSSGYRIAYVKHLIEKHGPKHIIFYDNNFTLKKDNVIAFCKEMVKSGINKQVSFSCQTNVVLPFDDGLLSAMKEANFTQVGLGVERLSREALELIRKNKTYETILHNIEMLNKHKIEALVNCLIGFPFDTPQSVREEWRLFENILEKIDVFAINNLMPVPGTEIYEKASHQDWYLDPKIMNWKPSFYHMVYNYTNNAWDINFFGLDHETQETIRKMKEHFYSITISKMQSPLVNFLHAAEKILARASLITYRISPALEHALFFSIKFIRQKLRSYFLVKYYLKKG